MWKFLFGLAVFIAALPFLYLGFVLLALAQAAWQSDIRAEQGALLRTYQSTFGERSKVTVLHDGVTVPSVGEPAQAIVSLSSPHSASAGGASQSRQIHLHSARQAEEECMALLATVASTCRVLSTLTDGPASVRLTLEFIQKDEGEAIRIPRSAEQDFLRVEYANSLPGQTAAGRHALYASIASDCREQETTFGNCVLAELRVTTRSFLEQGNKTVTRTEGRALMAVRRNFDVSELTKRRNRNL